ncbi:hypothetical protein AAC03nite_20590 [Alicyclobacillus acidoterrestris]|uniref:CopG family transcriptional regulator n=1 Tax=Alicyclobacillus suci TaxID=2816080 RepID=UPI001193C41E|nr:CopG family transcriptional regulator [Alicyclobacillus suci]GEO26274.1 hypothetical protein AAC03nite_20590 [Alicyclobacillus acidoterrestris]
MATEMRRFMVTIPAELEDKLTSIKQAQFFGDSWSEMVRVLLERAANDTIKELKPRQKQA